jgi:hypothetical protein
MAVYTTAFIPLGVESFFFVMGNIHSIAVSPSLCCNNRFSGMHYLLNNLLILSFHKFQTVDRQIVSQIIFFASAMNSRNVSHVSCTEDPSDVGDILKWLLICCQNEIVT